MLSEFGISGWISDASAVTYKRVVVAVSPNNLKFRLRLSRNVFNVNVILEAEIIRTFGQFLQQLVYCLALSGAGVADFEVFGVTIVGHLPRIFLVATLPPGGVGGLVSRVWLPSQRMLCLTIFLHQSLSGFVSCLCWTCGWKSFNTSLNCSFTKSLTQSASNSC